MPTCFKSNPSSQDQADPAHVLTTQTRKASLAETIFSTTIGFAVSLVLTATVLPRFGYQTTWSHDFWITVIFTVASVLRGYGVRRSFETGLWRRWIRG